MADVRAFSWSVQSALVLLLVVLSVLTGCGDGDDYTISEALFTTIIVEVSGTGGKRFRGDYNVEVGSTPLNSIPLEGTVPTTEEIQNTLAETVRATVRKVDPGSWTLRLCVQVNSQRACNTTTAEFGAVTATVSLS